MAASAAAAAAAASASASASASAASVLLAPPPCSSPPQPPFARSVLLLPPIRLATTARVAVAAAAAAAGNGQTPNALDFGARDPFPAELESKFGDKVLGNASTEHVILIPASPALGLADKSCRPLPPEQSPLSLDQAKALLRKIVGWRLGEIEGALRLQCEWKVKDYAAGKELLNRISVVADAERHHPDLHCDEQTNKVTAQLWTHSIGGLSENDFILAAKIDRIETSDLIRRNRFWA